MIIHIKKIGVNFNQKELIDIYRHNGEAKINYAKLDSVKNSELRKDTAFTNIFKPPYQFTPKQQARLDQFFEQYSVYHKNTVIVNLKKDTAYTDILNRLENTSQADLEKNLAPNIHVLDGAGIGFMITTDQGKKVFGICNPIAETHPIISDFLQKTIERAKSKK